MRQHIQKEQAKLLLKSSPPRSRALARFCPDAPRPLPSEKQVFTMFLLVPEWYRCNLVNPGTTTAQDVEPICPRVRDRFQPGELKE